MLISMCEDNVKKRWLKGIVELMQALRQDGMS